MKKDVIVSLVCLIVAILLFYSLNWIGDERARAFPRVVITLIGILSILLLVQTVTLKRSKPATANNPFPWVRCLTMFGLVVVYIALMERVGFYFSAFLFFVAVTTVFGGTIKDIRKFTFRIALPVLFTGVLYLLFNVLLKVQTPNGMLF